MRMHYLMFAMAIFVGIIIVIATYRFGILPRHERYQALMEEEQQFRERIEELEKKFSRSRPSAVVALWKEQEQPWAQAVSARISYFDALVEDEKLTVVVPEEERQFPKFWYARERQRRMDLLAQETLNANLVVSGNALKNHEPPPLPSGANPDADTVKEWLETYENAASFVREMIDARAQEIVKLEIWPSQVVMPATEGTIRLERVGYEVIITMENLARYLGRVHTSDTYISITALTLEKVGAASDPNAPVRASFILDRTRFIPAETRTSDDEGAPTIRRRVASGGPATRTDKRNVTIQFTEEELARIRAETGDQNPSFFRGILRWFGI